MCLLVALVDCLRCLVAGLWLNVDFFRFIVLWVIYMGLFVVFVLCANLLVACFGYLDSTGKFALCGFVVVDFVVNFMVCVRLVGVYY